MKRAGSSVPPHAVETPAGSTPPPAPRSRGQRFRAFAWRWTKRLAVVSAVLGVAGAIAALVVIRHYEAGLPSVAELKTYQAPQVTRVLARDGTVLAELFTQRRTVVPIASLPPHVKLAVLAAEDAGFYEHEGLNYLGHRAAPSLVNLRAGEHAPGRLDHHAAGREEPAPRHARAHVLAQDPRGAPRAPPRAGAHQGRDPRALPEQHLLRARALRHRGGRARRLRQEREGPRHRRGRAHRRAHRQPARLLARAPA